MRYLIIAIVLLLSTSVYAADKGDCYESKGADRGDYTRYAHRDDPGTVAFQWDSDDAEPDCSSWGSEVDDYLTEKFNDNAWATKSSCELARLLVLKGVFTVGEFSNGFQDGYARNCP